MPEIFLIFFIAFMIGILRFQDDFSWRAPQGAIGQVQIYIKCVVVGVKRRSKLEIYCSFTP